jgi:drug/metabolite transporter (DMT)-like permease
MPTRIAERPELAHILPHLVLPALLALFLLLWAKRRGASWTQVQMSFGAAMFAAFLTASGWIYSAYLSGQRLNALLVLCSQLLVGAACGFLVFFGTMPIDQDLPEPPTQGSSPR